MGAVNLANVSTLFPELLEDSGVKETYIRTNTSKKNVQCSTDHVVTPYLVPGSKTLLRQDLYATLRAAVLDVAPCT